MRTLKTRHNEKDRYLELVKQYPLKSIKTPADHTAAVGFLSTVGMGGAADEKTLQYMDTLAQLIDDYERWGGLKLKLSGLTSVDALRHLMDVHGLSVTAMGKLIGSQGTLSDILAGRRELSKAHIRLLAAHFAVSPALFL